MERSLIVIHLSEHIYRNKRVFSFGRPRLPAATNRKRNQASCFVRAAGVVVPEKGVDCGVKDAVDALPTLGISSSSE
jgi:hypothetical protein